MTAFYWSLAGLASKISRHGMKDAAEAPPIVEVNIHANASLMDT
jgi:hypothetical protein